MTKDRARVAMENLMKTWKWVALAASGGVLLQLSSCITDLAIVMLQAAASQLLTSGLGAVTT
jgi:hypothetical protein